MKKIIIGISLFMLTACGNLDRGVANLTGYSKSCINGVTYYQFPSGAVRGDDRDGKPIPC